jgi:hypothetical protein
MSDLRSIDEVRFRLGLVVAIRARQRHEYDLRLSRRSVACDTRVPKNCVSSESGTIRRSSAPINRLRHRLLGTLRGKTTAAQTA